MKTKTVPTTRPRLSALLAVLLATSQASTARSDFISPGASKDESPAGRYPELDVALASFRGGDSDRALVQLSAASKAHPDLPPARLMLARMFAETGQISRCRATLDELAAERPEHPGAYLTLGDLARAENRLTDARLEYEHGRTLTESVSLPEAMRREFKVQAASGLAGVSEIRGNWPSARSLLSELRALEPRNAQTCTRLARALIYLDRVEDATRQLEEAKTLDPTLDVPGTTLGWILTERGESGPAERAMRDAVARYPGDLSARIGLATWLLQRERPHEAREHAGAALQLDPKSVRSRRVAGIVAHRLGDNEAARAHLEAALGSEPTDLTTANAMALVLAEGPDQAGLRRALQIAESNARLHPERADMLATLGWVHYRAGRLDEALKSLRAAAPKGRTTPDNAYYLACVLSDRGEVDEAIRLLRSALDAPNGQFAHREKARRRLDKLAGAAATQTRTGRSPS